MKNYNVYKHADGKVEAVKQGWSWPGFLFGAIWALVKKLWSVAAILIGIAVLINIISVMMMPSSYDYYEQSSSAAAFGLFGNLLQLGIAIFLGVKGNSLREANLTKRGYAFVANINANNPDEAISLALKQ